MFNDILDIRNNTKQCFETLTFSQLFYYSIIPSKVLADAKLSQPVSVSFLFKKVALFLLMKAKPLNVEYMTMDASLLLPPTVTPLTGIDFIKRLPCGDTERTQRVSANNILFFYSTTLLNSLGKKNLCSKSTVKDNYSFSQDIRRGFPWFRMLNI